jgi:hypothetical protein
MVPYQQGRRPGQLMGQMAERPGKAVCVEAEVQCYKALGDTSVQQQAWADRKNMMALALGRFVELPLDGVVRRKAKLVGSWFGQGGLTDVVSLGGG